MGILLKTERHNFGTLEFGKTYTKTFPLKNETKEIITLTKVLNGGCSCVVSTVPERILVPGQQTTLNVAVTPGSTGFFRRTPIITFKVGNASEQSETVELIADVK